MTLYFGTTEQMPWPVESASARAPISQDSSIALLYILSRANDSSSGKQPFEVFPDAKPEHPLGMDIKQLLIATIPLFSSEAYGQTEFDENKLLAEQGNSIAQYNLGVMYENGKGVPENDADAVKWFLMGAGNRNASAQFNQGNMYDYGEGVLENNAEAVEWYRLAAEQGDALAQLSLGFMCFDGDGVPKKVSELMSDGQLQQCRGTRIQNTIEK